MAWHHHAPEIVVRVDCDGNDHIVRWRRGRLRLDDHDAAAEEALAGFGGRRPPCLDLLDLWRAAVRDGGFVEEWASRPRPDAHRQDWLGVALRRLRTEGVQDLLPSLAPARADRMGSVLVRFPPPLQDRAAVAVAARHLRTALATGPGLHEWRGPSAASAGLAPPASARRERPPDRPSERQATNGRLAIPGRANTRSASDRPTDPRAAAAITALQRHLVEAARARARIAFVRSLVPLAEHARPAALVPLACEVVPRRESPSISGRLLGRESWCHLRLGADWLVEVWGRGIAVVDGHLVVAVNGDRGADLRVTVVRWQPATGPDGPVGGAASAARPLATDGDDEPPARPGRGGLVPALVPARLTSTPCAGWALAWH